MRKKLELHTCPNCGGEKAPEAKQCRSCYLKSLGTTGRRTHHRKVPCSICGQPKLKSSKICFSCSCKKTLVTLPGLPDRKKAIAQEPRFDLITDAWMYYFVGLFVGEGCVRLRLNRGGTVSVNMKVKLRADDHAVCADIFEKLGGGFNPRGSDRKNGTANPSASWALYTQETIWKLLNLMKPYLDITPAKKVKEINLALEFLEWRSSQHFHNLDRAKCAEFRGRMDALRKYVEPEL